MKVQEVMEATVAFNEYAKTATESIDELVKVMELQEEVIIEQRKMIESLSRELAASNLALDRMDEADRKAPSYADYLKERDNG